MAAIHGDDASRPSDPPSPSPQRYTSPLFNPVALAAAAGHPAALDRQALEYGKLYAKLQKVANAPLSDAKKRKRSHSMGEEASGAEGDSGDEATGEKRRRKARKVEDENLQNDASTKHRPKLRGIKQRSRQHTKAMTSGGLLSAPSTPRRSSSPAAEAKAASGVGGSWDDSLDIANEDWSWWAPLPPTPPAIAVSSGLTPAPTVFSPISDDAKPQAGTPQPGTPQPHLAAT